ncbi:putative cop9 signalosome complex subunit 3 protein [Rosellinia necatrix]|uniref:Putative cop9 signalosome complex subunit 3 protein n=1 Tax=Rosellinia necatrix TaxID=77044 RepID=A0A1W2TMJ6_ROSNE|nr:putative cop9 signalosome complex subunit 3 protein [Rosellinia necatrix]
MDQCANALLAFPPQGDLGDNDAYHKAASVHVHRLSKMLSERARDLAVYSAELFEVVDPTFNSLSYLALLHSLIFPSLASSVPQEFILEKVVIFLMSFDGRQSRYGGSLLLDLMEAVGAGRLLPSSIAVETLATAILRLDPSGTMLTSSHIALAKLAYETDNIQLALPVIDKDIVFYPGMENQDIAQYLCDPDLPAPAYISKSTGLTAPLRNTMVLEHDLVCGMMYCARRDWKKARAAFERVVTFPTRDGGCSKIMVDAFKKWILVSLLADGCHSPTPRHTSPSATKTFAILGRPYIALATAFATDDVNQLKLEVENKAQVWPEDGNAGLVAEVMGSYQQWRVLSLQHVYTTISIPEIRQQTKSADTGAILNKDEDVEALIQKMIIDGMLKGVIEKNDDGTKFLVFLSPTIHLSEQEIAEEIRRVAAKLKDIQTIFAATKQRLGTSKEFIKWIVKEGRRDKSGDAQDPTLGFEAQIDDEDLMATSAN